MTSRAYSSWPRANPSPNASCVHWPRVRSVSSATRWAPTGSVEIAERPMGTWTSEGSTEDCWGRSLWGLGTAAASLQFSIAGRARERSSSEGPNSVRSIRAPWPSPSWARRPCSAFIRRTRPRCHSCATPRTPCSKRMTTRRGRGPSRASTTRTRSCPTP